MEQKNILDSCITASRACGKKFSSRNMCFLARPSDECFKLEEELLADVFAERDYELYSSICDCRPGLEIFCEKICSKIITSRFCIVILNPSKHPSNPNIKVLNPNVFLEYGMMLAFKKIIIPMQLEDETLPFNVLGLETIKYRPEQFKIKAKIAIDKIFQNLYPVYNYEPM